MHDLIITYTLFTACFCIWEQSMTNVVFVCLCVFFSCIYLMGRSLDCQKWCLQLWCCPSGALDRAQVNWQVTAQQGAEPGWLGSPEAQWQEEASPNNWPETGGAVFGQSCSQSLQPCILLLEPQPQGKAAYERCRWNPGAIAGKWRKWWVRSIFWPSWL